MASITLAQINNTVNMGPFGAPEGMGPLGSFLLYMILKTALKRRTNYATMIQFFQLISVVTNHI